MLNYRLIGLSVDVKCHPQDTTMRGKRVQFDEDTWNALDVLARDRMQDFQELADEAFGDSLRKCAPTSRQPAAECGEIKKRRWRRANVIAVANKSRRSTPGR